MSRRVTLRMIGKLQLPEPQEPQLLMPHPLSTVQAPHSSLLVQCNYDCWSMLASSSNIKELALDEKCQSLQSENRHMPDEGLLHSSVFRL